MELAADWSKMMKSYRYLRVCVFAAALAVAVYQPIVADSTGMRRCMHSLTVCVSAILKVIIIVVFIVHVTVFIHLQLCPHVEGFSYLPSPAANHWEQMSVFVAEYGVVFYSIGVLLGQQPNAIYIQTSQVPITVIRLPQM